MNIPFIKICCISSLDEARTAIDRGASALGLVSNMPSGPGVITEDTIAKIAAAVGNQVETVLLTSESEPEAIAAQVRRCGVSGVQLCTWLDIDARTELRTRLPDTMIMPVVHVVDRSSAVQARSLSRRIDRMLLDSGTLVGPIQELGGTGRTHDWELSRAIVAEARVPVLLAGGLRAENVGAALKTVSPFGVDVCSGVRSGGRLDRDRLIGFMEAAAAASKM